MNGEYIYGKDDLFALIIILKQMLREEQFRLLLNEISYELDVLEGKLRHIKIDKVLDAIGFPKNYKNLHVFLDTSSLNIISFLLDNSKTTSENNMNSILKNS